MKKPSLIGGACIVASVCVGAGMLALPLKGAGAWTSLSILTLLITMFMLSISGWLLLESYQHYGYAISFNTVTKDLLGQKINVLNNLSVYFVGGILLYAYTSVSGDILASKFSSILDFGEYSARVFSFLFVLAFSFFVWLGVRAVDRLSVILVVFMFSSFIFSIFPLLTPIKLSTLFATDVPHKGFSIFALGMLPVALTSFGYHHSVSSLRAYYKNENKAKWAILAGTSIALCFYVLWIVAIFGNISRDSFLPILSKGGELAVLLASLGDVIDSKATLNILSAFSLSAILSSFVGVGLGVFDYLADLFGFSDDKLGRSKTWAVTFIPPLAFSLAYPFGFVNAIGYAGAIATIWTCIIPALLLFRSRKKYGKGGFSVSYAKGLAVVLFAFGLVVASIESLNILGVLPVFKG